MTSTRLKYGIPDVELQVCGGGTVNPKCFVGHPLVMLFLPSDSARAHRELAEYAARGEDLVAHDTWIVAVRESSQEHEVAEQVKFEIANDKDSSAWEAFRELAGNQSQLRRGEGATFLFGRGGALQRVWPGIARVNDLVAELRGSGFVSESNELESGTPPLGGSQ